MSTIVRRSRHTKMFLARYNDRDARIRSNASNNYGRPFDVTERASCGFTVSSVNTRTRLSPESRPSRNVLSDLKALTVTGLTIASDWGREASLQTDPGGRGPPPTRATSVVPPALSLPVGAALLPLSTDMLSTAPCTTVLPHNVTTSHYIHSGVRMERSYNGVISYWTVSPDIGYLGSAHQNIYMNMFKLPPHLLQLLLHSIQLGYIFTF